jgi:hypothetical protein
MGGYFPGAVGKITELHAVYYHENWGFDISFETQVGRELSEFLRDFDSSLTVAKMKFCDFRHITGLKKLLAPQFAL